jgi:hypothetical protein
MTNMQTKRAQAAKLLRRYEKLRAELRLLEPELKKACVEYGLAKTSPTWGFRPEHLHIELEMEAERRGKAA